MSSKGPVIVNREEGTASVSIRTGVYDYGGFRDLVTRETLVASVLSLLNTPVLEGKNHVGDVLQADVVGDELIVTCKLSKIPMQDFDIGLGYDAEIEHCPGVHPTEGPYDAVQVLRHYKHAALVLPETPEKPPEQAPKRRNVLWYVAACVAAAGTAAALIAAFG